MALTLEHLRTLSVEELETLKRLHGDSLPEADRKRIDRVIAEKQEEEEPTEEPEEEEPTEEPEEEPEPTEEPEPEPTEEPDESDILADKITSRIMDQLGRAEAIADAAVAGEEPAEEAEDPPDPPEPREEPEDDEPETEHWFYRGRKRNRDKVSEHAA